MRGKRWRWAAGALVAAVLGWWLWHEPAWALAAQADRATAAPWETIVLTGEVTSSRVSVEAWRWQGPGGEDLGTGREIRWRTGDLGEHRVTLRARTRRGTERVATTVIRIASPPYLDVFTGKVVAPAPPATQPTAPFRITDIEVEKPELCYGEDTLVRMTARHDEPGREKWLMPVVNGEHSWQASFRPVRAEPGRYRIPILLSDPQERLTIAAEAWVVLKDCAAPFWVTVERRRLPGGAENQFFSANLRPGPAFKAYLTSPGPTSLPAAAADHWVWTFGDGKTATTKEPRIAHQFPGEEQRPTDRSYTSFPVAAEARDAADHTIAVGRTVVAVYNALADLKRVSHRLQLKAVHDRAAQRDGTGRDYVDVTLWNVDSDETATLTSLELSFTPCAGNAPRTRTFPPEAVFPQATVAPHASLAGRLTWPDVPEADGACAIQVEVTGTSTPGGLPVQSWFSLHTGAGFDTAPVTDPAQLRDLLRARELLGNPQNVSEADLARLRLEGKLR